jgi:hypothetical protein
MSRPPPPQPSPPTSISTGPPPATPLPLVQSPYLPSAYGDAHFGLLVRHVQGICDVLVETMKREHELHVDPLTDFAICCGQSEALAAAIFASSNAHPVCVCD